MAAVLEGERIGFLGAGAMAEAILRGLAGSGAVLMASDPDPARREAATRLGAAAVADNRRLAAESRIVVLAVKPQMAAAVLTEIGPFMSAGQTLLSIVAGLPLNVISSYVPEEVALIRTMPNTPALIGAGITGVALAGEMEESRDLAKTLLAPLGRVVFVEEKLLDAVTGLSGSGPAYVALFAEALIEAGVKLGLPRRIAAELAVETIHGSARMLAGGEAPGALRERVTSPGGTTAYGLYALEKGGFRAAVIAAVSEAAERAAALGASIKGRGDAG